MEITKRDDLMRRMALERFAKQGSFYFREVGFSIESNCSIAVMAYTVWSRDQIPPEVARRELDRARFVFEELLATDPEAAQIIGVRKPRFELWGSYDERDSPYFICRLNGEKIEW